MQEITKADLANIDQIRKNSKRSEEVIKIEISKVRVREGFNVRTDYGDIQSLADSILENSQISPARVDAMADGTFILTDGHRRFEALKLLQQQQGGEVFLKAVVNAARTTEEQRILQMFATQDNKPLTPIEVATLINRLINLGHDKESVAKRIGKSITYVSNMLDIAAERPELKKMVEDGILPVTTLSKAIKEIPKESERVESIKQAAEKNQGKKIKMSDISDKKEQQAQQLAEKIKDAFSLDDAAVNVIQEVLGGGSPAKPKSPKERWLSLRNYFISEANKIDAATEASIAEPLWWSEMSEILRLVQATSTE